MVIAMLRKILVIVVMTALFGLAGAGFVVTIINVAHGTMSLESAVFVLFAIAVIIGFAPLIKDEYYD